MFVLRGFEGTIASADAREITSSIGGHIRDECMLHSRPISAYRWRGVLMQIKHAAMYAVANRRLWCGPQRACTSSPGM
jgi:hypothetical protein